MNITIKSISAQRLLSLLVIAFAGFNASAFAQPMNNFKQEGYKFNYPQSWGTANAKKVAAQALLSPDDVPDGVAPAHLEVSFSKSKAAICFYPVKDAMTPGFKKKYQVVTDNVKMLKDLLKKRPTVLKDAPLLPWGDVSTPIFAHIKYLDNQNNSALRFVGQYNTECTEINNHDLSYTAQGLSKGEGYYLSVVVPVTSKILPAKDSSASWKNEKYQKFLKNYDSYAAPIGRKLDSEPENSFSPELAEFDAIVASIETPQK
jgi:hypothetical protein